MVTAANQEGGKEKGKKWPKKKRRGQSVSFRVVDFYVRFSSDEELELTDSGIQGKTWHIGSIHMSAWKRTKERYSNNWPSSLAPTSDERLRQLVGSRSPYLAFRWHGKTMREKNQIEKKKIAKFFSFPLFLFFSLFILKPPTSENHMGNVDEWVSLQLSFTGLSGSTIAYRESAFFSFQPSSSSF